MGVRGRGRDAETLKEGLRLDGVCKIEAAALPGSALRLVGTCEKSRVAFDQSNTFTHHIQRHLWAAEQVFRDASEEDAWLSPFGNLFDAAAHAMHRGMMLTASMHIANAGSEELMCNGLLNGHGASTRHQTPREREHHALCCL